jgi:drug/metabolite transporter (DMT)-like permease
VSQAATTKEHPSNALPVMGLVHLAVVYVVWGSTYLAIRVAVRDEGGFPPFTLGLTRAWVSGLILIAFAIISRQRFDLSRRDLAVLAISGTLMWTGGNGFVSLAEKRIDSGLAALLIAATPIYVAMLSAGLDRRPPSRRLALALGLGFSGVALLTFPVVRDGVQADVLSVLALLFAGMGWGGGSLLQSRARVKAAPTVSASLSMILGALGFLPLILITGEPLPSPSGDAWAAWGYLVVAGGIIAFVSYITILRTLPISITTTYAYVNPVIAVFLGWLFLSEPITAWTIAGSGLVLLGVAGVFSAQRGLATH